MGKLLEFLQLSDSAFRAVPMNVAKRYLTEIGCDSTGEPTDPILNAARFRDQVYGLVLAGGAEWFNNWCKDSKLRKPRTKDACGYANCGAVPPRKNSTCLYDDAGNRVYSLVFHAVSYMQITMQTLAKESNLNAEGFPWCGSIEDWALLYNEKLLERLWSLHWLKWAPHGRSQGGSRNLQKVRPKIVI